jgi:hypothetical protein
MVATTAKKRLKTNTAALPMWERGWGEGASRRGDPASAGRRLPSPGFATLSRKGRGLTLNTYGLRATRGTRRGVAWPPGRIARQDTYPVAAGRSFFFANLCLTAPASWGSL